MPPEKNIRHARYIGPLKELTNFHVRTALIRDDPENLDGVLAQFDGDDDWRLRDELKLRHPVTGFLLCYGWHKFPVSDFEKEEEK